MADELRRPLRDQLNERCSALVALRSLLYLSANPPAGLPAATLGADYQTVVAELEREVAQALAAVATELRKPTVTDLVDRLWSGGPLTFRQIEAAVVEAGAPPGELETLLNRFRNAGLLEASAGPTPASDTLQQNAVTLPPTRLLPKREPEITREIPAIPPAGTPEPPDVTRTYSQLVTSNGREWFDTRARAHGIDLAERIHCQF
jgi:hypothetical protein